MSRQVSRGSADDLGEGNGHPLQCSCLENPRDEGAWWAAVYGVAQGWTRLKRLSSSSSVCFVCLALHPKTLFSKLLLSCFCVVVPSCLTLCDPVDSSPPGSSVHGISQARILEGVAISSSRGSSLLRDQTRISCIASGFFTTEPLGKSHNNNIND